VRLTEIAIAGAIASALTLLVSQHLAREPETRAVQAPAAPASPAPRPAASDMPVLSANAAHLRLEDDGHYWANANVDGAHVKFMVDTGASTVALTFNDAQRIGLRPDTLDYKWRIRTAGGEVMGASVMVESIQIGRVEVRNVEAMVLRENLSQSLLGMTFLSQLESYEFRRGNLILRQ